MPSDRLKDTHFLGANLDLFESEKTLLQFTYAHAFNVADGFNGLMVLPNNPLTGEVVGAPVVMRYTPSANLGGIHLAGLNLTRKAGPVDLYASANFAATRPNGLTTPLPRHCAGRPACAALRRSSPEGPGARAWVVSTGGPGSRWDRAGQPPAERR